MVPPLIKIEEKPSHERLSAPYNPQSGIHIMNRYSYGAARPPMTDRSYLQKKGFANPINPTPTLALNDSKKKKVEQAS